MTIGLGLVGCGRWGLNYLHAFSDIEGCRLIAACDMDRNRLAEAQRRQPGIETGDDLAGLLTDPAIDAVIVATDASRHAAVVTEALRAGKDCLVEKPMTTDPGQARQLQNLARTSGRLLMVGHVFRFNPGINYLQRLIGSHSLGDLEYLTFTRTNLGPIRSDVNVVWDLVSHDVSILLHFLNQSPAWVSAQGASFLSKQCEDIAFATLGFPDGLTANIRASWLDPRKVREITVVGTQKMAFFDDLQPTEPVRIYDKGALREPAYQSFGEFKLVTRTGDVTIPAIPGSEPLKNQCQHFVDCVRTRRQPLSDASDGLRVVEVLAAINQSIARRGAPIAFSDSLAQVA